MVCVDELMGVGTSLDVIGQLRLPGQGENVSAAVDNGSLQNPNTRSCGTIFTFPDLDPTEKHTLVVKFNYQPDDGTLFVISGFRCVRERGGLHRCSVGTRWKLARAFQDAVLAQIEEKIARAFDGALSRLQY